MKKLSIIIPIYNRKKYIDDTIQSCLDQGYEDMEVIIVDDGSTDGLGEYLKKYNDRIRYYFQKNQGAPAARNQGLSLSCGEYILFLDAGECLEKDILERMMALTENDVQLVVGNFTKKYGEGIIKKQEHISEDKVHVGDDCYSFCCLAPQLSTKIYKKDCIIEYGVFFSDLHIGQDLNFFMKYLLNCEKIHTIPDYVFCANMIDGGISMTYNDSIAGIVDAFLDIEKYIGENREYKRKYQIFRDIEYYHLFWQIIKAPRIKEKKLRKKVVDRLLAEYDRVDSAIGGVRNESLVKYYNDLRIIKRLKMIWTSNCFHVVYGEFFELKEKARFRRKNK